MAVEETGSSIALKVSGIGASVSVDVGRCCILYFFELSDLENMWFASVIGFHILATANLDFRYKIVS